MDFLHAVFCYVIAATHTFGLSKSLNFLKLGLPQTEFAYFELKEVVIIFGRDGAVAASHATSASE